jgi:hypothetical protein
VGGWVGGIHLSHLCAWARMNATRLGVQWPGLACACSFDACMPAGARRSQKVGHLLSQVLQSRRSQSIGAKVPRAHTLLTHSQILNAS